MILQTANFPGKATWQPENCPLSRYFTKVLSGNYWHLQRLSSIEGLLNGRFSDKSALLINLHLPLFSSLGMLCRLQMTGF